MDPIADAAVELNPETFLTSLVRHLSGTLQDVIGLEDAAGFLSVVGKQVGAEINRDYRQALSLEKLSRKDVARVLVDLKKRIGGEFRVIEESADRIVLGNTRCPFGDKVVGRPSLCMMTSNVFGDISAQNLGYAKVHLAETIALGASGCRVVIYLRDSDESREATGREYFSTDAAANHPRAG